MLHALFIAICAVGVVFFLTCIHGLIADLRKDRSKGIIGDLNPRNPLRLGPAARISPRQNERLHRPS